MGTPSLQKNMWRVAIDVALLFSFEMGRRAQW
jgi:hypothetical protein